MITTPDPGSPRLLRARYLFDGVAEPIEDGAVLINEGRILEVGPTASIRTPADVPTVDLGDVAILPGMIDAHLHFQGYRIGAAWWPDGPLEAIRSTAEADAVLRSGFTTVRDCGSANGVALRTAIDEGTVRGPRIVAAGPPIGQTGSHIDDRTVPLELMPRLAGHGILADGADDCRRAVRRVIRAGADVVKICTTGGVGTLGDHMLDEHFTPAEIAVIVDEAHRLGVRVAAHAQGAAGVLNAVNAGVDTIEHGYFIDEACVDAMLERGTGLVPTFGLIRSFRRSVEEPDGLPAWRTAKQRDCIEAMQRSLPMAAAAGIPIATGSDAWGPAGRELGSSADELVSMVRDGGLDPMAVLRSATSVGGRLLGLEGQVGHLTPGASADIVAVAGRPWSTIEDVRNVRFVMARGNVVVDLDASVAVTGTRETA